MTGSYTPGPWGVHDHRDMNGAWWIGPGPFDTIGEVRHGNGYIEGDELANARLIAAAPELLEALRRLAKLTPFAANAVTADDLHMTVKAIAESAIAKATSPGGEQ